MKCPHCEKEFESPNPKKVFCSTYCRKVYGSKQYYHRTKAQRLERAKEARASFSAFGKKKQIRRMYRRGTLDMPKCSVKGCANHLFWSGERLAGICFHHRNLQRRRNQPKVIPTLPQASFAGG